MIDGHVHVHSAKIAAGRIGANLTLLHVPSDRFVVLYEHAETLWHQLEQGMTEIAALVQHHARAHGLDAEVAAYEVIAFLDELRAHGIIDYRLPREREVAPLIDSQTSVADLRAEHLLRVISGQRPFDPPPLQRVVALDADQDVTTLAELEAQLAATPAAAAAPTVGQVAPARRWTALADPSPKLTIQHLEQLAGIDPSAVKHRRVVHMHGPSPDLTVKEIETVSQLGLDAIHPDRRGTVHVVDDARADLSIGELEQLTARRSTASVVIVISGPIIVIIDGGVVIIDIGGTIIIVVGGGPGPTRGKSRSACKTMCV